MDERVRQSLESIETSYDPGRTAKYCAENLHRLIKGKIVRTEGEVEEAVDLMMARTNADPHAFAAHFISICVNGQLLRSKH